MQNEFYFPISPLYNVRITWSFLIKLSNLNVQSTFSFASQITNGDDILVPDSYNVIPAKVTEEFDVIMQGNHWLELYIMSLVIWHSVIIKLTCNY